MNRPSHNPRGERPAWRVAGDSAPRGELSILPRGFTLIEVSAAAAILTVAMSIALAGFTSLATQQRSLDRRLRAEIEVANALERLSARSWDSLAAGRYTAAQAHDTVGVELADSAQAAFPGAELWIEIVDEPSPPAAKRLTASVLHRGRAQDLETMARLTTWVYAPHRETQEREP